MEHKRLKPAQLTHMQKHKNIYIIYIFINVLFFYEIAEVVQ